MKIAGVRIMPQVLEQVISLNAFRLAMDVQHSCVAAIQAGNISCGHSLLHNRAVTAASTPVGRYLRISHVLLAGIAFRGLK